MSRSSSGILRENARVLKELEEFKLRIKAVCLIACIIFISSMVVPFSNILIGGIETSFMPISIEFRKFLENSIRPISC